MRIQKLTLKDFRNIASLTMEPCGAANIICADNAQGKTSLLEAIWLFCGAKSFRGAKESELIRLGTKVTGLNLEFFAENRSQTISLRYYETESKQVDLNGVKLNRPGELTGSFHAVVFSPDHLWIIKHEPQKRRKLLDVALCQIYPKYQKALESYERILRQRSFLLKDARNNPQLLDTIEVWDTHAAEYGSYIAYMRSRYIQSLSKHADEIYRGISGGKEALKLSYLPGFNIDNANETPSERSEWKKYLSDSLCRSRAEDLRFGSTTVGPHRDDLIIEVDNMSARSFASQGQQRSCVLALKLAECELLTAATGEPPVILLDDVMSELDEHRRGYLLNSLKDKQAFITCCDKSAYEGLEDGFVFSMREGRLNCIST